MKSNFARTAGGRALALLTAGVWAITCAGEESIEGRTVSQWVTQLQSQNKGLQVRASRALSDAPKAAIPAIIPQVMPLLKSERENNRFVAAQVLGEYRAAARAAVPDLVPLLQGTQHERNRAAAAKALGQILKDAPESEEIEAVTMALVAAFKDPYEDVRRESVTACGMIGPAAKACVPSLTARLQDNMAIQNEAAWACGRIGAPAAVHMDRLVSIMMSGMLRIDQGHERMGAVPEAIGILGAVNPNVVPNLVAKLEGVHSGGGFAPQQSRHEIQRYGQYILRALNQIGPPAKDATPYLTTLLTDPRRLKDREQVLRVLQTFTAIGPGAKEAIPAIETLASNSDNAKIQEAARAALASLRGLPPETETAKP